MPEESNTMNTEDEIHLWQHCHHCNESPITGVRYECQDCPAGPDIDLCSTCFELYKQGKICHPQEKTHFSEDTLHKFLSRRGELAKPIDSWLDIPMPEGNDPQVENGFVVRPEFCFAGKSVFGGHGFVVNTSKGLIFLTALHVLDEVIKKSNIDASVENNQYTGKELPQVINTVNLYDVMEDKWMFYDIGLCGEMMVLPDARVGEIEPISYRDISAFTLKESINIRAGTLAMNCPDIGEPIWLVSKMSDRSRSREAVVVDKTAHSFVFRYESNEPLPKYCSGAPLLNKNGQVVAINVGGGFFKNQRFGHANHVGNIRQHLGLN